MSPAPRIVHRPRGPSERGRLDVEYICAVYFMPDSQPQLILRRRTATDDHALLAGAWQVAIEKAHELGWIV